MSPPALPIVTYHSLDDSGSPISIAPAAFAEQVAWLAHEGFTVVTLSEGLARLRDGSLADRTIALTFDDGYLNAAQVALPLLAGHGFSATVFLVAERLGGFNDWSAHGHAMPRMPLLERSSAEELDAAGWEIGAHTRTHPDLSRLAPEAVRSEVAESRVILEERLGTRVVTFAYPYGRHGQGVRAIVAREFASAVTTRLGLARQGADPLTLERIDAYYLTRPGLYGLLGSPLLSIYLTARQAIRDLRRVAVTMAERP